MNKNTNLTTDSLTEELLDILLKHPERIREVNKKYIACQLKDNELQRKKKTWNETEYIKVSKIEGADGKKLYTNDTQRNAEVDRILNNSNEYQALLQEERDLFMLKGEVSGEIEQLRLEHKGAVAATRILGGE